MLCSRTWDTGLPSPGNAAEIFIKHLLSSFTLTAQYIHMSFKLVQWSLRHEPPHLLLSSPCITLAVISCRTYLHELLSLPNSNGEDWVSTNGGDDYWFKIDG